MPRSFWHPLITFKPLGMSLTLMGCSGKGNLQQTQSGVLPLHRNRVKQVSNYWIVDIRGKSRFSKSEALLELFLKSGNQCVFTA